MSTTRIAFLGLGIMGGGMTRRLIGGGFPLTVFNRNRARSEPLAAAGATVAASPRDAAAGADIVFSMVADDTASRAMWFGPDGALAGAARGAVLVECSTLTVAWVRELAAAAAAQGAEFVDAPVTGSKNQAAAGELNFLAGGSAAALDRIRPALLTMGKNITHLGPTGSGALLKLINNSLAGVHVAAIGEALGWIERSGLDRGQALAFLSESAIGSPVTKTVAARMSAADYSPNFSLKLMTKDLGYAVSEAAAAGATLATAETALRLFRAAVDAGHGEKDMAAASLPSRPAAERKG